jgi:antitoxin PrlF
MPTDATLTSKGQTTIPKEIRDGLGMKPGDRMTFTLMPDATVVMRVKNKSVTELAGMLHKKGRKPVPVFSCASWCAMTSLSSRRRAS